MRVLSSSESESTFTCLHGAETEATTALTCNGQMECGGGVNRWKDADGNGNEIENENSRGGAGGGVIWLLSSL